MSNKTTRVTTYKVDPNAEVYSLKLKPLEANVLFWCSKNFTNTRIAEILNEKIENVADAKHMAHLKLKRLINKTRVYRDIYQEELVV